MSSGTTTARVGAILTCHKLVQQTQVVVSALPYGSHVTSMRVVPADVEVEVLDDTDTWRFGILSEWRRDVDGGWHGWVRWSAAKSMNRVNTFPADRIRRLVYCPWRRGRRECLHADPDCRTSAPADRVTDPLNG